MQCVFCKQHLQKYVAGIKNNTDLLYLNTYVLTMRSHIVITLSPLRILTYLKTCLPKVKSLYISFKGWCLYFTSFRNER